MFVRFVSSFRCTKYEREARDCVISSHTGYKPVPHKNKLGRRLVPHKNKIGRMPDKNELGRMFYKSKFG